MTKIYLCLLLLISSVSSFSASPAPEGAEVYFISPTDGDTIKGGIVVRFGLKNMGVAPAGTVVENTGHHHILVDTDLPALDQPIPNDVQHHHFGKGQTETVLELDPGKHTLQLLLGDFSHVPHEPPVMSEQITIMVE